MSDEAIGPERSGATKKGADAQTINCDQVHWLLNIFDRYLPHDRFPGISQHREMLKYGMLYEVMDIAYLKFEDDSARWNGTPNPARNYGIEDQSPDKPGAEE